MNMHGPKRSDRIAENLARQVALILKRLVKDPRVSPVTITGCKVTPDLGTARVFYNISNIAEEPSAEVLRDVQQGLDSAAGFVHRELVRILEMKVTPRVVFTYDNTLSEAARIDELLHRIHREDPTPG